MTRSRLPFSVLLAASLLAPACSPAPAPEPGPPVESGFPAADTVRVAVAAGESLGASVTSGGRQIVELETLDPARDGRDLLDQGLLAGRSDALVTRDPVTIAYARSRTELRADPLAWDQVYLLVVPDPTHLRLGLTPEMRAALARDAVRADARAAAGPYWFEERPCLAGGTPAAAPARRIAYPAGDATARDLAERFIALSGGNASAAIDPAALPASVARGAESAYVFPLPRTDPVACGSLPAPPQGSALLALVETRPYLVTRRDETRVLVDSTGALAFR